jgi:hypothetical protein
VPALVPDTKTLPPPGLTATALATSELLFGPLYRFAQSFSPDTAGWWDASSGVLAMLWAAEATLTPSEPTTAAAASAASVCFIGQRMANLPDQFSSAS